MACGRGCGLECEKGYERECWNLPLLESISFSVL